MPARYEKLLALSLVAGFLLFFVLCSCEKENLIDPPDFFDPSNPEKWTVCAGCGIAPSPAPQYAPPPEGVGICTGDNPTSGPLCIQYSLTAESDVSFSVYSPGAELIIDLVRERKLPGTYYVYWELTDSRGAVVPDGVYRAYFKAGGDVAYGDIIVDR